MVLQLVYCNTWNRFKTIVDKGWQLTYTVVAQTKREKQWLIATVFSRFHLPGNPARLRRHISIDPLTAPWILHINIEDLAVSRNIIAAGKLLDIEVLDHLVIGQQRYVSLKERGLAFE